MKKKVVIVVGTRPEAIKLIPVYFAFSRVKHYDVRLVSTGQHKEMLQSVFDLFQITADYDLALMKRNQTLGDLSSKLLQELTQLFDLLKPEVVFVQGDTTTSMIASMAAFYQRIKVAHVEAGLRSFDMHEPFPEEFNRKVISLASTFHFVPTTTAKENLLNEGIKNKISVVGNTVIDSLLLVKELIKKDLSLERKFEKLEAFEGMILITGHRRENFGTGMESICQAIAILADRYPNFSFVYPVHLNPNVQLPVRKLLGDTKNIFLLKPVPYNEMVYLMIHSFLILTDSGGIQEEAPSLGKPVLVMRNKTERPEGVESGCSVLVGTSKNAIVKSVRLLIEDKDVYTRMSKATNPYGKGNSAQQILKVIGKLLDK